MIKSNLSHKMKKFRRSKLAQVRGVDFALAMLIFIIAFSQVVLVLTNLLIPSLVQMETYSQEQDLSKIYHNIFLTEGSPSNWGNIGTSSLTDFRLGLLEQYNSLDFTKINRLASGITNYWGINYINVKTSYGLINDFAIEISSPIKVSIDVYTAAFGEINLYGSVKEFQTSIEDAKIWAFVIDADGNIASNSTTTQELSGSISFHSSFSTTISDYYTVVVFAEVGIIYQDYTVMRIYRGGGLDYSEISMDYIPFVRENTAVGYSALDISVTRAPLSDVAKAIVVFPFEDSSLSYFSYDLQPTGNVEGEIYLGEQLSLPSDGLAVVVVHERENIEYRAGYMGVPMFLRQSDGGIFGIYSEINQETYISESYMMNLRGLLVRCRIWYW
ncbi:MAG: hypothetical protein KGD64_14765 [Candidatus Heimdallarchaeota archaeon]|nr:hypothetical protein [Candidatus Heimdallarchaeota archaeon]